MRITRGAASERARGRALRARMGAARRRAGATGALRGRAGRRARDAANAESASVIALAYPSSSSPAVRPLGFPRWEISVSADRKLRDTLERGLWDASGRRRCDCPFGTRCSAHGCCAPRWRAGAAEAAGERPEGAAAEARPGLPECSCPSRTLPRSAPRRAQASTPTRSSPTRTSSAPRSMRTTGCDPGRTICTSGTARSRTSILAATPPRITSRC